MARVGAQPMRLSQSNAQGGSTSPGWSATQGASGYANPIVVAADDADDTEKACTSEISTPEEQLRHFIRENFHRKQCNTFEAKDAEGKCGCGEQRSRHDPGVKDGKWKEACLEKVPGPTDAFGRITLKNEGFDNRDPIHFVRLCDEDDMEKILELMKTHWQMAEPQKPSLCISVIGGAKNFKLEGRKKEVFHHGLIRAAQTTNAWIITSGLNLGITRVVGNALEEGRASHWEKESPSSKLRCIGVAPWGYVLNRESLVNTVDRKTGQHILDVEYNISNVIKKSQPVSLNANHTHYLLIDDGKRNRYGGSKSGVIKAKLQEQINQKEKIPVVLLIVEGGLDIFEEALSMIESNIPIVICDDTGRAADIIAFAFKKVQKAQKAQKAQKGDNKTLTEAQMGDLRERMVQMFRDSLESAKTKVLDVKKLEDNLAMLLKIVQKENLITVFDTSRSDDLDLAILSALLKVMDARQLEDYKQQLQLSITWNRPDIAAEKIFTEDLQWDTGNLERFTKQALLQDKIEFVRLFLKNGLIMREFLTLGTLRFLYWKCLRPKNLSTASQHVRKLLAARTRYREIPDQGVKEGNAEVGKKKLLSLAEVRVLLRKLIGKFNVPVMDKDTIDGGDKSEIEKEQLDRPFNQLFFWAVLLSRQEMAKFIWERTDESIPLALAACKVYDEMARTLSSHEDERKRQLLAYKSEFENLAVRVIEECQDVDNKKAETIIEKQVEAFGDFNCLELAASAGCKKFLSCKTSQSCVNNHWLNGLLHGTSNIRIFTCVLLPFLLPFNFLVMVDPSSSDESEGCCVNLANKIRIFYTAPVTKFFANAICYVVFVFLYSWFILFEMLQNSISWLEALIMTWICIMLVEEVREMFSSKADTVQEKLRDWWSFSVWNRLDVFTVLLALIAMFLRIPQSTDMIIVGIRTCYVLAGVLFYLRVFRLYYVNSYLGPKLVMIQKMVKELLFYMCILLIALFTYGVAAQALLYPNRDFYPSIFADIVYHPYWQIYGEIYLEVAEATPPAGCGGNSTVGNDGKLCPTYHALVLLLLAVYLMVVNVLLINLLIAIFSNIFKDIQQNSIEVWKFNMYFLVHEYKTRPVLAVPFVIVEDVIRFFRFLIYKYCCKAGQDGAKSRLVKHEEEIQERIFVSHCLSQVQIRWDIQAREQIGFHVQKIDNGVEEIYKTCDHIHDRFEDERRSLGGGGGAQEQPKPAETSGPAPTAVVSTPAVKEVPPAAGVKEVSVVSASVNEDVNANEKLNKLSKDLGLPPINPTTARSQSTPRDAESHRHSPAKAAAAQLEGTDANADADAMGRLRKLRRREEKERRRAERRGSRSRRQADEVAAAVRAAVEDEPPGAVGGFGYQTLNDFNISAASDEQEERLAEMERRLRNMETATTESLTSIEKLLKQILKDGSKQESYSRLQ